MVGVSYLNENNKEKAKIFFQKALASVKLLSEDDWHKAYPGNDPVVAGQGLSEMVTAIEKNLQKANSG